MLVGGNILQPSHATTTITRRTGTTQVQDGPFAETKEALAGVFVIQVPDAASMAALRVLERLLGRRCGGSTGTNLVGALELMCEMRGNGETGPVVTLICDDGNRYAGTYYDDTWLAGQNMDVAGQLARLNQVLESGTWT